MKALYFIALSLLIVSCKNQGKMDLEAAKTATVDSMEVAMEKQRVIDSMQVEMTKVETQKETIIVISREIIQLPPRQPQQKKKG
jgi:hypothetical protein